MRSIETEGDTIDEAIASALQALEVSRDRVEIEILTDASRGLFGFGGTRARVRATVRRPLSEELAQGPGVSRETKTRVSPEEPQEVRASRPAPARTDGGTQELAARAQALVAGILEHLGLSSLVEPRPGGDHEALRLEIVGEHGGLLIGRRGQTLDAIEYLVNRMLGRDDGAAGRVVIDVERYRERRREYLEALARRLADKAVQTGRTVTLNPMSPRDRRIVHLTLQESAGVTTRSDGDGSFRRVLIIPAAESPRRARTERAGGVSRQPTR